MFLNRCLACVLGINSGVSQSFSVIDTMTRRVVWNFESVWVTDCVWK